MSAGLLFSCELVRFRFSCQGLSTGELVVLRVCVSTCAYSCHKINARRFVDAILTMMKTKANGRNEYFEISSEYMSSLLV